MCVVGNNFLAKIIIFHLKQNDQPKKNQIYKAIKYLRKSAFSQKGDYMYPT